jgi:hypothetical protein
MQEPTSRRSDTRAARFEPGGELMNRLELIRALNVGSSPKAVAGSRRAGRGHCGKLVTGEVGFRAPSPRTTSTAEEREGSCGRTQNGRSQGVRTVRGLRPFACRGRRGLVARCSGPRDVQAQGLVSSVT